MRVTIAALGFEMDLTFGPATAAEDAGPADLGASLDGGTTASTPVGFTAAYDVPEEVTAPQHCPAWDEPADRRRA